MWYNNNNNNNCNKSCFNAVTNHTCRVALMQSQTIHVELLFNAVTNHTCRVVI